MKDKSIKSTMKSWIMLSEKELDDTQVYMQEQEQQDQQEKDNSFSEAESGSGNVGDFMKPVESFERWIVE